MVFHHTKIDQKKSNSNLAAGTPLTKMHQEDNGNTGRFSQTQRHRPYPVHRFNNSQNKFPSRTKPSSVTFLSLTVCFLTLASIVIISFATWNSAFAKSSTKSTVSEPVNIARFVRPNDMNSGGLLLPSKRPGYYVQAPRLATDVKIDISGPIVRTIVSQRFENPSDSYVEGIYVFPLPENSAVDTLKMQIGKRYIEGKIKPRIEARKIYEKAKRDGKKASLLEQQRPNIFTNAVANIGPGEAIIVQIEYQQTIKQSSGLFSLRFPMVVAPRYNPQPITHTVDFKSDHNSASGWGVVDPVPDHDKITPPVLDPASNAKINPVTMRISLAAGFPLGEVKSVYHTMKITRQDEATRTLVLSNETIPADRDFELTWKAKGSAPNAALFKESIDGKDYILAFITPPALKSQDQSVKPREAIFVIDNSGSMAGESLVQAKLALANALSRLSPGDKFNIVRFDDTYELVFPSAVTADRENISRALRFVSALEADGGTEMLPALRAALIDTKSGDTTRIRQVIFITDGAIGNEQQLFDAIASGRGRSRVFTIGIGSAPNSFFMHRAAEIGRGTFAHIGAINEVTERMTAFLKKLENPVLTGLKAEVKGGKLSSVTPDPLPDLYSGEPVILAATMKNAGGTLTITGDYGNQPWQISMNLANATRGKGIGKLWARRKIASLEASRSRGENSKRLDQQIETTALNHHLVSRLTSLVAVDISKSRPEGNKQVTKEIPTNLPRDWEFDKVFGEVGQNAPTLQKTRVLQKKSYRMTAQLMAAATNPDAAKTVARNNQQPVILPQTATRADRNIILGALLILLASMLTMISAMWQNVGNISRQQATSLASRDYNRLP